MRILITGASGFVGRALVPALAQAGHQVRAAARDPKSVPSGSGITPIVLPDLAHAFDADTLIGDAQAVIHLAGLAHVSADIPEADYDAINHRATHALARAAAARKIKRFVLVSSIRAQSGPQADQVLTEDMPARPTDAYGRSKRAAEQAVRDAGLAFTILRPVVIYGPGATGNVRKLRRLAASPFPLPFARFDGRRSLLALDNFISAIQFVLNDERTRNETYIVADGAPITLAEMLRVMRLAQGRSARLFAVPPSLVQSALRIIGRGDLWERIGGTLIADSKKLRSLGWHPPYSTPQGLAAMVQAASP